MWTGKEQDDNYRMKMCRITGTYLQLTVGGICYGGFTSVCVCSSDVQKKVGVCNTIRRVLIDGGHARTSVIMSTTLEKYYTDDVQLKVSTQIKVESENISS